MPVKWCPTAVHSRTYCFIIEPFLDCLCFFIFILNNDYFLTLSGEHWRYFLLYLIVESVLIYLTIVLLSCLPSVVLSIISALMALAGLQRVMWQTG